MNEIQDIHKPLIRWLRANNLPYLNHRPDVKSGIQLGWPDFTICHCGRCLLIEAKKENGKLSPKQVECVTNLRKNGNMVKIVRSAPEAISAVQTWMGVEKPGMQPPERENEPAVGIGDVLSGRTKQDLWIGTLFGVAYVFRGNSGPGETIERVRRATNEDLCNIPQR